MEEVRTWRATPPGVGRTPLWNYLRCLRAAGAASHLTSVASAVPKRKLTVSQASRLPSHPRCARAPPLPRVGTWWESPPLPPRGSFSLQRVVGATLSRRFGDFQTSSITIFSSRSFPLVRARASAPGRRWEPGGSFHWRARATPNLPQPALRPADAAFPPPYRRFCCAQARALRLTPVTSPVTYHA